MEGLFMNLLVDIVRQIIEAEIAYLKADWFILFSAITIAAIIQVYAGQEKMKNWRTNQVYQFPELLALHHSLPCVPVVQWLLLFK